MLGFHREHAAAITYHLRDLLHFHTENRSWMFLVGPLDLF